MDIDLYEREVKVIMENGGIERLKKQYMILSKHLDNIFDENKELKKKIAELESKLEHSSEYIKALRSMLGIRSAKENIELANKLYGLNLEVPNEEEPLPFSDEQYEEDLIEELEDRHQQDCITINQLNTTIDTLVDRYAKLREMREL